LNSGAHSDSLDRSTMLRLAGRLSASGIRVDVMSSGSGSSRLRTVRELIRRVAGYKAIHLLYTGGHFLDVVGIPALIGAFFRRRLILHYHYYDAEVEQQKLSQLRSWIFGLFNTILTPCESLRQPLSEMTDDVRVIPDNVSSLMPKPRVIEKLQPHILVAGPLEKASNISSLIRALRFIKEKYPRAELTIAGDGPMRRRLEGEAHREAPHGVSFVGDVDLAGLGQLMNQADVLSWVGVQELPPRSVQLAMACGLPVIATEVDCAGEFIANGNDGILIPIGDQNQLVRKLLDLIESPDLTRQISIAAAKSGSLANWDAVSDRWLDLYPLD
jgi:glycosyltransferase involved in cell wall biosynthesis